MSRFEGAVVGCEPPDRPLEFAPVVGGWSVDCEPVTDWSDAVRCLDYTEELFATFLSLVDGVPFLQGRVFASTTLLLLQSIFIVFLL